MLAEKCASPDIYYGEKFESHRMCPKCCVANEISFSESLRMLEKAFNSKIQVYDWYKAIRDGREVVENMSRPGRPSTSKEKEMVTEIPGFGIWEIASHTDQSNTF